MTLIDIDELIAPEGDRISLREACVAMLVGRPAEIDATNVIDRLREAIAAVQEVTSLNIDFQRDRAVVDEIITRAGV